MAAMFVTHGSIVVMVTMPMCVASTLAYCASVNNVEMMSQEQSKCILLDVSAKSAAQHTKGKGMSNEKRHTRSNPASHSGHGDNRYLQWARVIIDGRQQYQRITIGDVT